MFSEAGNAEYADCRVQSAERLHWQRKVRTKCVLSLVRTKAIRSNRFAAVGCGRSVG